MIPIFHVTSSHTAPDTLRTGSAWQHRAVCRTSPDDELWYADPSDRATIREAIAACLSCPVLLLCRQAAADEERGDGKQSRYGVRGGLTPVQRWAADPHTQAGKGKGGRRLAPCGTDAAYERHRRDGEQPCDPCRRAHNKRNAQLRAEARHRGAAATECGTRGGYQKHRRNGEAACGPCRQANADADRRLRNVGTTTERSAA
ncbi:WhiB family transcriptional regulator [Streptomyces sp. DH8]|uniref:WhiB family transcriptional regulator n=1 Tax=Streptomyces sp. DH8 TaxID=2857008 RepID=UPI001E3FE06D|nr:WhiB family transcriptional regulator [Streptomyces sp. DH8]